MREVSHTNLKPLAKELLQELGNNYPTQKQLELMNLLISKVTIVDSLLMSEALTNREASCLYLAAMGRTSIQTAEILNIQPHTVNQYHKQIKEKLNCQTLAEAVFKGFRLGYFTGKEEASP